MIDLLEQALIAAVDGDRKDVEHFFKLLLESKVTVARRFQHLPLSDSPQYPNELLDLLGVKDKDRVVVPAFTRPELVREWSGTDFLVRELAVTELLAIIPDEWWITLNPGSEVEKELSPWELTQLKSGTEAIPVLVEESAAFEEDRGMSFVAPPQEFLKVQEELKSFAAEKPAIESLYLLQREKTDPTALPALVVGVRTSLRPSAELDALRGEVLAVAEKAVIGAATMQVMMGGSVGTSMLDGVFSTTAPFYTSSNSGVLGKLKRMFGRK